MGNILDQKIDLAAAKLPDLFGDSLCNETDKQNIRTRADIDKNRN